MINIERDEQYGGYWVSDDDWVCYFDQLVTLDHIYDEFIEDWS